jgi:hypothetical protein
MKQALVHKISFGEADGGYTCTEQEILERELRTLDLYGTEFAYTAFSPELKSTVLKKGSPHANSAQPDNIDCCIVDSPIAWGEPGIRDNVEYDLVHYLDLTSEENRAMFVVYDKSKLVERAGHPYYKFREPDKKLEALLAVVEVNW